MVVIVIVVVVVVVIVVVIVVVVEIVVGTDTIELGPVRVFTVDSGARARTADAASTRHRRFARTGR